jgi:glycerophosphoryl diester phosphodiesterase
MKTKIIASECCAGLFPQNTLSGFLYCLEQDIDGIEFDVHLSRDEHVVVHHDYLLNRRITRDVSGNWLEKPGSPLCQLTLDELKKYDVGRYLPASREEKTYPDYNPIDGQVIPTLAEFVACYGDHEAHSELWIELKTTPYQRDISSNPSALLEAVLDIVTEVGLAKRTMLLAFEWDLLVAAKDACPDIRTDFLTINPEFIIATYKRTGLVDPDQLYGNFNPKQHEGSLPRAIRAAGGDGWGPYVNDVTKEDVMSAQELGLEVNLWGVESSEQGMASALSLEANSITLARPDLLRDKLALMK